MPDLDTFMENNTSDIILKKGVSGFLSPLIEIPAEQSSSFWRPVFIYNTGFTLA